jgi:hypothetical protein
VTRLAQEVEISAIVLRNILPAYDVDARPAILEWWGRMNNPMVIAGLFTTNRAARRHPPRKQGRHRH